MFFFYEINLYADAILQIFFILSSFFGWYSWHANIEKNSDKLTILRLSQKNTAKVIIAILIMGLAFGYLLNTFTNADYAYYDSILLCASIITTLLSAKAYLENWYFWIVINSAYIVLYIYKEAHLTAILYLILIVLAIIGLRDWRKSLNV